MEKVSTFIEKLPNVAPLGSIFIGLHEILSNTSWEGNQIGLKHRIGATDIWKDGIGSLYDRVSNVQLDKETSFTEWSLPAGNIIRQEIERLESQYNFKSGRIRFMKLKPRVGLSVHRDDEIRYHLVLKTNPYAYICVNDQEYNTELTPMAKCYHMPADKHWYRVDTTQLHWVYNGGNEERIHLVICEAK